MSRPNALIAIVDDDASVCRALSRVVRSAGMDAKTFASGQELIDRLGAPPRFSPDCVVLDLHMAGLSGLEVQERLTGMGGRRLPVVFITAYDEVGARDRALAGGAVAFLRKPLSDEMFIGVLDAAVERDTDGR